MIKLSIAALCLSTLSLISCGKGLNSNSGKSNTTATSFKKIYLASFTASTGDIGINDMDTACGAGYKALVGSSTRHPDIAGSGAVGWVLAANTEYRRQDGVTVIGTTNANAVFDFPLTNSLGSTAAKYYTGLQTNWTLDTAFNCSDWGSMADDRTYGDALSTNANAISESYHNCGTTGPSNHIACVEQ